MLAPACGAWLALTRSVASCSKLMRRRWAGVSAGDAAACDADEGADGDGTTSELPTPERRLSCSTERENRCVAVSDGMLATACWRCSRICWASLCEGVSEGEGGGDDSARRSVTAEDIADATEARALVAAAREVGRGGAAVAVGAGVGKVDVASKARDCASLRVDACSMNDDSRVASASTPPRLASLERGGDGAAGGSGSSSWLTAKRRRRLSAMTCSAREGRRCCCSSP